MSSRVHRASFPHRASWRWLGAAACLFAGIGAVVPVASAHEVKILPMESAERSHILPIVVPGTHLSLSPSEVDFGTFDLFFSSTRELAITNVTDETLTLGFELMSVGLSVEPSSLSLGPGEDATLTLEWFPELGGTLDEAMTVLVSHDGVGPAARREVPLSGTVISVLDFSPRSFDFGVIDRAATATGTLEVINLEPVQTTVSILPSSPHLFVDPPSDQLLGPAGSATERQIYSISFKPVGIEMDLDGGLMVTGAPVGGTQTPHLVRVVAKSSDLGTSGIFDNSNAVAFLVGRPGSRTHAVPLWNRSAVDTVAVSLAVVGGADVSVAPAELEAIGPGEQTTVEVTWAPAGDAALDATLIASISYPGVAEPVVNTKEVWGWSKTYPVLPTSFDFGTTDVGSTEVIAVTLANPSTDPADLLTVEFPGGSGFSLQPNDQTLGQVDVFDQSNARRITVAGGETRTVSFLWTPSAAGSVNSPMDFRSWYADVEQPNSSVLLPIHEQIPVSGTAIANPAELVLREVSSGQEVSSVSLGTTAAGEDWRLIDGYELVNTGGVPVSNDVSLGNMSRVIVGGDLPCSEDEGRGFCIISLPLSTLTQDLRGLAPGASVPVTFMFRGQQPGDFAWSYSVDYDGGQSLALAATGELTPYLGEAPPLAVGGGAGAAAAEKVASSGDYTIDIMGPRLARGYGVDRLFHDINELDSVNLFNGNLTIALPIGNPQVVSPALSYGFTLVYNSNIWDRWSKHFQGTQVFAPFPGATAGVGWSLHLGRLCAPTHWGQFYQLSQAEKDKVLCRGNYWSYIGPDGRKHDLSGASPNRDLAFDMDRAQMRQAAYLYAKDGSYLRLKRVTAAKRQLEFPDGTIQTFETGSWNDDWDDWRLTEMKDRYGNTVTVTYDNTAAGMRWTLSDCRSDASPCPDDELRKSVVELEALSNRFFDYRVSSLELPGFDGARRTFVFRYTDATVARPWQGEFNPGGTFTVPQLTDLQLPDHSETNPSEYSMQYYASGGFNGSRALRILELETPTKGRIQWDYGMLSFPLGGPCAEGLSTATDTSLLLGVTSRKILYEGGGTPATEALYRYAGYQGSVIPPGYCDWDEDVLTQPAPTPAAEHVTAVVVPLERDEDGEATRNKVTLNYFSVFPVTVQDDVPLPGGGWTGAEYGLPFTRNGSRNADGETLYLSTRLYDAGSVDLTQLPKDIVAGLSPVRSRFVRYALVPRKSCDEADACAPDNARLVAALDVFHDDGGNWRLVRNKNPDGLGHFRRTEIRANNVWDSRTKTIWKNWHPDAGTLFSSFTSLTDVTLPDEWILGTSSDAFVQVGSSARRATDECWETVGNQVRLKRVRKRAAAAPGDHDLIVQYSYDPKGRIELEEFFGGDLQTVPANVDLCSGALGTAVYSKSHSFTVVTRSDGQKVERGQSQIDGLTHFESDADHDLLSGLVVASRDIGGRETTFSYDGLGRLQNRFPPVDAVERLDYQVGITTQVTFKAHVAGDPAAVLKQGEVVFDDLGRVSVERERMPDGTWSRRQLDYDMTGRVRSVTTAQPDASWSSEHAYTYRYDVLGRPIELTQPDVSSVAMSYQGERVTSLERSVGTTFQAGGDGTVTQSEATFTRNLDPFGRLTSLVTPAHTTTFTYDSADELLTATRGAQTRTYERDGRGLLLSEAHPETGTVTYSEFDALGNSHLRTDGHATLRFELDGAGRPTQVLEESAGGRLLKELSYHDAGNGQGQIDEAVRVQYLESQDVGGLADLVGEWRVAEKYTYGADGRVSGKTLTVTQPDGSEPATFDQAWEYTDLGHVWKLRYPRCRNSDCPDTRRTVTNSYGYGRLTGVTTGNAMGADLAYYANGIVASLTHGDGSTSEYGVADHYMQRVATANLGGFNLGALGYDGSGNLITLGPHRYTYDTTGRLKEHYRNGAREDWYGYTSHDVLSSVNGQGLGIANATNRLSGESYTAGGHQETDAGSCATLEWDALGKLRSYRRSAGCGQPAAVYAMLYTADGSRVLVGGSNGFQWELRDEDGKLLSVFEGAGAALAKSKEWVYAGRTTISSRDSSGTVSHLHADHLGTPRGITRNGELLRRNHSPFGEPLDSSQGEALDFAGHQKDPNGDSVHMQARTYDPTAGRFFSPDPARTGWNLYAYASNDPLNRFDRDGREDEPAPPVVGDSDSDTLSNTILAVAWYLNSERAKTDAMGFLFGFIEGVEKSAADIEAALDGEDLSDEHFLQPSDMGQMSAGFALGEAAGKSLMGGQIGMLSGIPAVGGLFVNTVIDQGKHTTRNTVKGLEAAGQGDADGAMKHLSTALQPGPKLTNVAAGIWVVWYLDELNDLAEANNAAQQEQDCQSEAPEWQQNGAQRCP